tara:strand:- start:1137 stop:1682 length:546 start_codon:yes stop_codon:yes gene_type:complete
MRGKKGSMKLLFIVMIASILIAMLWNSVPMVKDTVHLVLDPTAGSLLNWNTTYGMMFLVLIISLVIILFQKYGTDQETLRQIKKEQKEAQKEMKQYKNDPQKLLEMNKKQMEKMPQIFSITMRPLVYTFVPLVLFFRWFSDFFTTPGMEGFKFFGILTWFWFYLIMSIIFSSIFRKILKVA